MLDMLGNVINEGSLQEFNVGYSTLGQILMFVANFGLIVGFFLAIVGIAAAFVLYIVSQGDPKAIQRAQTALLYSGIAAFVSLMGFVLKNVVVNTAAGQGAENNADLFN